jgi:hypothetical protein
MNGGVIWGRPRPGRGCSAIYGMFCPHYTTTTTLLLGPRCGDVFEVLLQLKAVSKLPVWSLYGYCTSWKKQCFSLHPDTTPPQPNHKVTPTRIVPEQCNPWNNSTNKSQAPEDGCINIRNMLSIKKNEIKKQVTSSWSLFIQISQPVVCQCCHLLLSNTVWGITFCSPLIIWCLCTVIILTKLQQEGGTFTVPTLCMFSIQCSVYLIACSRWEVFLASVGIKW